MTLPRKAGFATLLVLVTMAWLALIGLEIVSETRMNDQFAENLRRSANLEAAARGAVIHAVYAHAAAREPGFEPNGPPQTITVGGIPVVVTIRRESDFININTCPPALMESFLVELGVPQERASTLAAAITASHTRPLGPRPAIAGAAAYAATGRAFGPSRDSFRSVDEIRAIPGVDQKLFALMAPHLTVLSNDGPNPSTRDAIVARALARVAGNATPQPVAGTNPQHEVLRVTATIREAHGSSYSITLVARPDFSSADPSVRILLRMS